MKQRRKRPRQKHTQQKGDHTMTALELTRTPYTSDKTAGSSGTMDVLVHVRAPAHAWRNRWQAVGDVSHYLDNDPRKAGEVYWSRRV